MSARLFRRFSSRIAQGAGQSSTFGIATLVIVAWAVTGPVFGLSNTWQLVINTSTTIVTFLMVFLIQNTRNRDSAAVHLKLDELIRATAGAHNVLLDLEERADTELEELQSHYADLGRQARGDLINGLPDPGAGPAAHVAA